MEVLANNDFLIALVTFIGAIFVVVSMLWWIWQIRTEGLSHPFIMLFASIATAKIAIADWAVSNLIMIYTLADTPPIETLRSRILLMFAVMIQVGVAIIFWQRRKQSRWSRRRDRRYADK